MRGIQYAAASRFYRWRLWNTGSPGPGDDSGEIVIASAAKQSSFGALNQKESWIASSLRSSQMTAETL